MTSECFMLAANGWVPNNSQLPVIVYRAVERGDCDEIARAFERRFGRHGWPPDWRDTVYDYHHYHSTAHEALGVAAGHAVLELGGPRGRRMDVSAGNALVLPAGTGHRRIHSTEDFLVVGAYPAGQEWDICCTAP
ncbi:cupin [Alteriqipengyuania flavescens]|nr:cupin [Alteriqipengyuania flavescens]WJY25823.1 cupin [Alteriqipengyuania flavescens]